MLEFWWRPLLALGAIALAALILSVDQAPGTGWAWFSAGLLAYLTYHLSRLRKLTDWLGRGEGDPPEGSGLWGETFYRLYKLLRGRQVAQRKVSADLERMLEAARNLPDGVIMLDEDNRILWFNDAAARLLGFNPDRDIGQFLPYLLRNSRFVDWLMHDGHGQDMNMETPGTPPGNLTLKLVKLPRAQKMLLAHDTTELIRVEAMRRDFIANVSHELRTPITVIVGFLEAFDDMPDPDPVEFRKHIPLMREQSDRIRRLVDDLLTLARLESEPEPREETVDMAALARRLADEAETMSQRRQRVTLRLDSHARLIGNGQELYSALANLVTNAVRYTPADGRITLRWGNGDNGTMVFAVTDTGEGIEARHIPRLTERFYRVDRGRSRATGGTGLGLAIVKHVLQRHQARLRIDSTVGKGSTFTAVFPAERIVPETGVDAAPPPAAP
jgi:two-component system phosphate regulon sensor histidine kinase PhoR